MLPNIRDSPCRVVSDDCDLSRIPSYGPLKNAVNSDWKLLGDFGDDPQDVQHVQVIVEVIV